MRLRFRWLHLFRCDRETVKQVPPALGSIHRRDAGSARTERAPPLGQRLCSWSSAERRTQKRRGHGRAPARRQSAELATVRQPESLAVGARLGVPGAEGGESLRDHGLAERRYGISEKG